MNARSRAESLIARYYGHFNRGERAALLALLDEAVVHEINHGATETGREAFAAFLARMDRCYSEQAEDLVILASEDGKRGAAEFFIRGAYLATDEGLPEAQGQAYHIRVGAFFELEEGKVRRVTNYYNLAGWLEQIAA